MHSGCQLFKQCFCLRLSYAFFNEMNSDTTHNASLRRQTVAEAIQDDPTDHPPSPETMPGAPCTTPEQGFRSNKSGSNKTKTARCLNYYADLETVEILKKCQEAMALASQVIVAEPLEPEYRYDVDYDEVKPIESPREKVETDGVTQDEVKPIESPREKVETDGVTQDEVKTDDDQEDSTVSLFCNPGRDPVTTHLLVRLSFLLYLDLVLGGLYLAMLYAQHMRLPSSLFVWVLCGLVHVYAVLPERIRPKRYVTHGTVGLPLLVVSAATLTWYLGEYHFTDWQEPWCPKLFLSDGGSLDAILRGFNVSVFGVLVTSLEYARATGDLYKFIGTSPLQLCPTPFCQSSNLTASECRHFLADFSGIAHATYPPAVWALCDSQAERASFCQCEAPVSITTLAQNAQYLTDTLELVGDAIGEVVADTIPEPVTLVDGATGGVITTSDEVVRGNASLSAKFLLMDALNSEYTAAEQRERRDLDRALRTAQHTFQMRQAAAIVKTTIAALSPFDVRNTYAVMGLIDDGLVIGSAMQSLNDFAHQQVDSVCALLNGTAAKPRGARLTYRPTQMGRIEASPKAIAAPEAAPAAPETPPRFVVSTEPPADTPVRLNLSEPVPQEPLQIASRAQGYVAYWNRMWRMTVWEMFYFACNAGILSVAYKFARPYLIPPPVDFLLTPSHRRYAVPRVNSRQEALRKHMLK